MLFLSIFAYFFKNPIIKDHLKEHSRIEKFKTAFKKIYIPKKIYYWLKLIAIKINSNNNPFSIELLRNKNLKYSNDFSNILYTLSNKVKLD